MPPLVDVRLFTDPACPVAYSSEPWRFRLRWLFGDQLRWQLAMIVLSEDAGELERKGLTTAMIAAGTTRLAAQHGMPIDTSERTRLAASVDACRAVVATRRHQPESEALLLRRLRFKAMGGDYLDEQPTIAAAAAEAGVDPEALSEWVREPAVEDALRADMRAARTPLPAALALAHKLAKSDDGLRYTCPTYEIATGNTTYCASGFFPIEAYELLFANAAPELERRPAPESVEEVLRWADEPLATAEVAAVMGIAIDDARAALHEVAQPTELGTDALWELATVAAA